MNNHLRVFGPSEGKIIDDLLAGDYLTQYSRVDGTRAFTGVVGGISPTENTHLTTKGYVDQLFISRKWQNPVLSRYNPTPSLPAAPVVGDRYIATATANGWTVNRIYECITAGTWVGATETTPTEGYVLEVIDEDLVYWFNGVSWVNLGTSIAHDQLVGLTTGDAGHTQFALLVGRSGGQILIGGTGSGDDLELRSSSHNTKGEVYFGAAKTSYYDEANDKWVLSSSIELPNIGLKIRDTNASHFLSIVPGSDLTANKTFTLTTGDSDRTITLSGNPTLADWFDQAVKTTSSPTFAAPIITTPEVNGSATGGLSVAQVSNSIIHNIGQGAVNCNLTLPAAAAGYSFVLQVGEPSANYLRITAASGDQMIVDGEVGKTYASFATPGRGNYLTCHSFKELVGAGLAIGTTITAVGSNAFTYTIGTTKYAKAAVAAGTAPGNDVIVQAKYGAVAFDIGVDGTIDAVEAVDQAAQQFTTADAAIAALPAVEANHWRMGYVTATKSDGAFTFGTTALNAANSTVAYTSTAGTSTYNWIVSTGAGTVTTD